MEHTLNLLIIEDDTAACTRFAEYADISPKICIVGITNNSYRAIELVCEMQPDAVILDLELNQGKGNGLNFLQELKKADIPFKPYVLVTTNNTSNTTYDYAREYGADFIMSKHKDDYSEKNAIDFLEMMKDIIQTNITKQHSSYATTESPVQYEKRLKKRISMELDKVGICPKANGYQYLIDAIYAAINGTTTNICVEIARQYSKTPASVERASQNAINRAWKAEDIDVLLSNYTAKIQSERGVPTLTEFICFYANKIKNGY